MVAAVVVLDATMFQERDRGRCRCPSCPQPLLPGGIWKCSKILSTFKTVQLQPAAQPVKLALKPSCCVRIFRIRVVRFATHIHICLNLINKLFRVAILFETICMNKKNEHVWFFHLRGVDLAGLYFEKWTSSFFDMWKWRSSAAMTVCHPCRDKMQECRRFNSKTLTMQSL